MTAPLCEYCKHPTTDCGPDGYGGTDWWCKNPECEGLLNFMRRVNLKPFPTVQGVWPDFIAPPKHDNPDPRWQDPSLPDFRLIWKVARECGYSVGLHGSMKRDCDMIAAPWTDDAVIAFELIDRLCSALNARIVGPVAGKPHGRLGWNLQVDGYVKVIDISVMPRSQDVSADLAAQKARADALALAICGGEDVPGYAAAQTVETLEQVARDNANHALWLIDKLSAAEAKVAALEWFAEISGDEAMATKARVERAISAAIAEVQG